MLKTDGAGRQFGLSDFITCRYGSTVAPPGVRFRPLPISDPFSYNPDAYIEIDNNDVTARAGDDPGVEWETMHIGLNLTRQANQVTFSYKKRTGDNFLCEVGSNVKVYDSGSLVFQGRITSIDYEQLSAALLRISVTAIDFTNELDGKLINENFSNQTIEYIINFLLNKYAPQFTMNNVRATQVIQNVTFTLEPLSKCLQDLAAMTGFDWYVDQYKDVHFNNATQYTAAPITLMDDNESFEAGTLHFKDDISQLKNSVYVRGGNRIGDSVTTTLVAAAGTVQTVFQCGYHFNAKPAVTNGGVAQTVGVFNVDDPALFQCMWNPVQDTIIFSAAVTGGNAVAMTGQPLTPIRVYVPNRASIAQFGERQLVVQDNSILTYPAAIQRAQAELLKYAQSVVSMSFVTRTKGVFPGQYINFDSVQFGKSGTYIITKVDATFYTPVAIQYTVTCISTKLYDIVDLMIQILRQPKKAQDYPANEAYDPAEAVFEDLAISEDLFILTSHNPQPETITITDSASLPGGTGLSAGTIFVAGPWVPSGVKRVFNLNRSPLG